MSERVTKIIQSVRRDWDMPASLINSGYCEAFAEDAASAITEQTVLHVDIIHTADEFEASDFQIEMPIHYWIRVDGIHYDAEAPSGVQIPEHIPFFSRLQGEQMFRGS